MNAVTNQKALDALAVGTELIDKAKAQGEAMPNGPEKDAYLNFLRLISKALSALQEVVYQMQANQSSTSKTLSRANLDMQLNDLEKQQKAADEVREKTNKFASMGSFGKIFEWIIRIILMILSFALGPLAAVISVAYFASVAVSRALGQKNDPLKQLCITVSKSLPPGAAAVINTMISMAMCSPFLSLYIFFGDARVLQDTVKAMGGSKMAQEMVAMVVQIIVMLAVLIFVMIITGGAATAATAQVLAGVVQKALEVTATTAEKIVSITRQIVAVTIAAITITADSIKLNNNILLAQIDIIKGESEAYSAIIQGIIAQIKKVIAILFQILQGNSDFVVSISNFQGKKWTDASNVMSNLVA